MILGSRLRALGLVAAVGAAAIAACTATTTTTTFTPITGIEIRSAALVAGFGCGTGAGQVFRYAAAVSFATDAGAPGPVLLSNIFDCFADGVFENLPTSDAGSLTFNVKIFAYNEDDYLRLGLPPNLGCVPTADGGALQCDPSTRPLTMGQQDDATWTTTCLATQQAGTPVIAVCPPLSSRAPTGPDASTDAAADGPAADAAVDAAQDATTSTEPDGGARDGGATDGGTASPDADASSADGSATDGSSSTD